ncbi:MAG: hypothetical protein J2P54_17390, partial [Bradyrhizobiaceae bacterium]|nr:hypothetical protein [Bradyrhizobiaceae bacterium]
MIFQPHGKRLNKVRGVSPKRAQSGEAECLTLEGGRPAASGGLEGVVAVAHDERWCYYRRVDSWGS